MHSSSKPSSLAPSGAACRTVARTLAVLLSLTAVSATAAVREGGDTPAPHDDRVLERVRARVDSVLGRGEPAVVLLDIDGTLLSPAPRHRAIFAAYAETHEDDADTVYAALGRAPVEEYVYAPEATLAILGITDEPLVERMKRHWVEHFFSNRFLAADTPIPGGPAFVRDLWERGAWIAYLTGRDVPRMLEGTVGSLRERGYPIAEPRVLLLLKPDPGMSDAEYKEPALDAVARLGTVVAVFENEPRNLNLMADRFPRAEAVFVDTEHSPRAVPVRRRASWIGSYETR